MEYSLLGVPYYLVLIIVSMCNLYRRTIEVYMPTGWTLTADG